MAQVRADGGGHQPPFHRHFNAIGGGQKTCFAALVDNHIYWGTSSGPRPAPGILVEARPRHGTNGRAEIVQLAGGAFANGHPGEGTGRTFGRGRPR